MKRLLLSALLAATAASAVNFSGKWAIETPGRGGRGGAPTILVLNHVGKEVTGSITARSDAGTGNPVNSEVLGGVAEGDTISFYVWSGTDQPVKTIYKGAASGEETIIFTVTGGPAGGGNYALGRGQGEPQKVTAKRTR
ncbi:MAG TPA: hypothetical protein VLH09_03495 [Bryobacteraceae bacterium]|nr:hypothetical protein [Bryobacteraceae bacterium]